MWLCLFLFSLFKHVTGETQDVAGHPSFYSNPISTLVIIFVHFVAKKIVGYFPYFQMSEYFRLNIEY